MKLIRIKDEFTPLSFFHEMRRKFECTLVICMEHVCLVPCQFTILSSEKQEASRVEESQQIVPHKFPGGLTQISVKPLNHSSNWLW